MLPRGFTDIIKRTFLYDILLSRKHEQQIQKWRDQGSVLPPPHILKQKTIKEYAQRFSLRIFIETGTYMGNMVEATRNSFPTIYSIELDQTLYKAARNRFADYGHITILHGDSGVLLEEVLQRVQEPCLFWLDGHYSSGITAKGKLETPISQELKSILGDRRFEHSILIDDARCFLGQNDYPTIEQVKHSCLQARPDWVFEVKDDIIRFHKE